MTIAEQQYMRDLLQQHIANICTVHFAEYGKAQALCCVVKQVALKYYASHSLYALELDKLNFINIAETSDDKEKIWNSAIDKLLTVAHAMLNDIDASTPSYSRISSRESTGHFYTILLIVAFVSLSCWIWFFHKVFQWEWFANHPRRIPLQITCQLLLMLLVFFTTRISRKQKENAAILVGIILGMIALI